jgi:hypothetical protein
MLVQVFIYVTNPVASDIAIANDAEISDRDKDESGKVVQCDVCLTEVPLSVARSAERLDYVHDFCRLNCLEKWLAGIQSRSQVGPQKK